MTFDRYWLVFVTMVLASMIYKQPFINERIAKLEKGLERGCAHGIAVMTPSGAATTICQP